MMLDSPGVPLLAESKWGRSPRRCESKNRDARTPAMLHIGAIARTTSKRVEPDKTGSGDETMTALVDKVAIVTGASSGIGYATAKLFAEEGAKVVVSARRRAELDALVVEIEEAGGNAVAVAGDVRDEALAEALVETAVGRFGGLDVAFNNAGSTGQMAPVPAVARGLARHA